MSKVAVQANKLENADVTHISLVGRGANRSPFKIIKQEKPMISLNLKTLFKAERAAAAVLAFVIQKSDATEEIRKALKEAGVNVEAVTEMEDGTVVFKQCKDDIKEGTFAIIKMAEDFVALVSGIDAAKIAEGLPVEKLFKDEGFLPGAPLAEAMYQKLAAAATLSPESVKKLAESAADFAQYVGDLNKVMPELAVKADAAFHTAKAAFPPKKKDPADPAACDDDEEKEKEMAAKREAEEKAKKAEAEAAKKAEELAAADKTGLMKAVAEMIAKSNETLMAGVQKALEGVNANVSKGLTDLGTQVAAATTAATEAKELAVKNEKTLKGVVLVDDTNGDRTGTQKAGEGEGEGELGQIDTAFSKNVRKREKLLGERRSRTH